MGKLDYFVITVHEIKLTKEFLFKLKKIFLKYPGNEKILLRIDSGSNDGQAAIELKSIKVKTEIGLYLELIEFI
jgi:hypothetical protein|tara:strand:- start:1416 stop:1637 length:222 start_codon:yes stop_codon:yes gene_type:complete